jgi:GGDEF domain-containing protein
MSSLDHPVLLRIMIAVSAPLPRARLRNILLQQEGIEILWEEASGSLAVQRATDARPNIFLCDEKMLEDPVVETFAQGPSGMAVCSFVLVTANTTSISYRGPIRLSAVIRLDTPGPRLAEQLFALVTPAGPSAKALTPRRVAGMQGRFLISGELPKSAWSPTIEGRPNEASNPGEASKTPTQTDPLITRQLNPSGRRRRSPRRDALTERLAAIQVDFEQHRDYVTGLANTKVLGRALRALPEIAYPAAIIVVHLWNVSPDGAPLNIPVDAAVLRRASAALRANLRQEDVVCRLQGVSFAVIMPGIDELVSRLPLQRIRAAFDGFRVARQANTPALAVAIGVGYWAPPMTAAEPLDQAWQAMVADRMAYSPQ